VGLAIAIRINTMRRIIILIAAKMRRMFRIFAAIPFQAMVRYIYQYADWPRFSWDDKVFSSVFGEVRHLQGKMAGQMNALGFSIAGEAMLRTITMDVVKSSEIEGERLNYEQVRSSVARRLGMDVAGLLPADRKVEGVVEMMLDATQNYEEPLTQERLFGWHSALFPSGHSGMHRIAVGGYRSGVMQIVSGTLGNEKVHYEAIAPAQVKQEMDRFLEWFNEEAGIDPVLKSAVAHFWFIIIHPFDDGNGRMARALSDLLLARAERSPERFYSLSSQIMTERKRYYEVLQRVQYSRGDITEWINWFLHCLRDSLIEAEHTLQNVLTKAKFWRIYDNSGLNSRQRLMLNKLMDGFEGKLTSSKWAKITKCSQDTALRDLKDLMEKGIVFQDKKGGRSTNYRLGFIMDDEE